MNSTSHVGNTRLLRPVVVAVEYQEDSQAENDQAKNEEEPEEPLGIVTEVATIIFLVAFTNFLPFISKHGIDLTDMHQHLCGHPLAFFGKQFLNLLPVSIIDIYRHLKFCGTFVYDVCISFIIAAYRFSVSWILRLRVSAFLLQFAVTVLYILASSVKTETSLSTYFSSS